MKSCPGCDESRAFPDSQNLCEIHGMVLIKRTELDPGFVVNAKYRIERLLGSGGMGHVYLATDLLLQQPRALKFLMAGLETDPHFVRRFMREAQAASKIDHPNVVRIFTLEQRQDGSFFLCMEYVKSGLYDLVSRHPNGLPVEQALALASGIAQGLQAAHAAQLVHRDIKTENILLAAGPEGVPIPKIADFGIVARIDAKDRTSITRGRALTPAYASPEQFLGVIPTTELDGRTDLYALGVVFFEMLTGRLPFGFPDDSRATEGGWAEKHCKEAPPPPSSLRRELLDYPGLDALVLKLMAKQREDRPASADDFLQELKRVVDAHKAAQNRSAEPSAESSNPDSGGQDKLICGRYRVIRSKDEDDFQAWDTVSGTKMLLRRLYWLRGRAGSGPMPRIPTIHHANVAEASGPHIDGSDLYLAFEDIEGETLLAALDRAGGLFEIPRALRIARGVASGLKAIHANACVHGNIDPENLRVVHTAGGAEQVKIFEVGFNQLTLWLGGDVAIPTDNCVFTAPEVWTHSNDTPIDGRADSYSLGGILYRMLAGRAPWESAGEHWLENQLKVRPPKPSTLRPAVANYPELDALVLRMLDPEVGRRPEIGEFLAELDRIERQAAAPSASGTFRQAAEQPEADAAAPARPQPPPEFRSNSPAAPSATDSTAKPAQPRTKPVTMLSFVKFFGGVFAILLLIFFVGIPVALNISASRNEKSALETIRAINMGESLYNISIPPRGYACSLSDLTAQFASSDGTQTAAPLAGIDPNGIKNSYRFTIDNCIKAADNGRIVVTSYRLTAVPVSVDSGNRGFCSDQTGKIAVDPNRGTNCTAALQ